jgi:FMN phosphatase YigB (HAD superfamily)
MKKLFRFLYALLILAAPLSNATDYTPKNTIFVWDIHGVMLDHDGLKIAKLLPKVLLCNPSLSFLKKAAAYSWHLMKGEAVQKEIFLQAARAEHNEKMIDLLIKLGNSQKEIPGTPQVVAAIKHLGYTNYVASNIDNAVWAELINPAINPKLAPFFLANFNIPGSQSIDYGTSMENVAYKPNPAYFERFIARHHLDLKKTHAIFIDDTLANIESARKLGFTAIHFINAKQLVERLNCMGIPVSIVPTQASIAASH